MSHVASPINLTPPRVSSARKFESPKETKTGLRRIILAFAALSFVLAGFGIWLVPAQTHQPEEALLRLAISLVLLIFGLSLSVWARLSGRKR